MFKKVAVLALSGLADTGGGIGAWRNPEATSIIIDRVTADITTKATAACTANIGTTATSAVTSSDNLLDGIDVGTAAAVFNTAADGGTNGKTVQKLASGKWVTVSTATGAAAGLVGKLYITYHRVS